MEIEECIKIMEDKIKEDKNFLWNHPERGNEEFETSKYVAQRLLKMGYKVENIGTTGILATVKGKKEGKCVLFRSELDALEMESSGRMKHTCGHDSHMTMLLALAQLIMNNKNKLRGTIKLAFEPAEETTGGAKMMINEGVLESPRVDYVFGIHVWSELKKGTVAIKPNVVMASTDPFEITVYGKGGHAALPEKCVDPIYISSIIVSNLQAIIGRNVNPNEIATVGITSINGGNSNNLIPNMVKMKGICRTYGEETRKYIKKRIIEISTNIAKSMNGTAEIKFREDSYPQVVNDEDTTKLIYEIIRKIYKKENIIDNYQTMSSDDIAYFLKERPGTFIFLGCTDKEYYPQHSENFYVDYETIISGIQILYEIVKKINFIS